MLERFHFLGVEAAVASPRMRMLFDEVRRIAARPTPVLLLGEPGSGKEIVARAIHHYSNRRHRPFVDLSCGALPRELVETELFGHEKGVFSGASTMKPGLFELASQGTLFLDDVRALDARLQAKLLRVVETSTIYRVGAVRSTRVDVRLVMSAGNSVEAMSRESGMNQELHERLSAITLTVPSLRERPEDIEALACHFLNQQNPELRFAADAMMALYSYQWPGNVRELRNAVLRSAMMAKGPLLHGDDIVFSTRAMTDAPALACGVEGVEEAMIRRALVEAGGQRQRAADSLGITKATLSRRMRSYGLQGAELVAGRVS